MPWAEVGFERLLIIEAFAAFAVPQAGLDHVPAGGNEEFFVGLGDAVPRQTGRLKHVLVTRPAADNEGDGDRDPLARTVVRPAFGARQLREFASGAPAAVGDALPAVHEGEFDLRLARGNLAINRVGRERADGCSTSSIGAPRFARRDFHLSDTPIEAEDVEALRERLDFPSQVGQSAAPGPDQLDPLARDSSA